MKMAFTVKKMISQRLGVWMGMWTDYSLAVNVWQHSSEDFLSDKDLRHLDVIHNLFLGPPKEMLLSEPMADPNKPGRLIGGMAFERCGQILVRGSGRCYSLTMMHQRQRVLVGPTARTLPSPPYSGQSPLDSSGLHWTPLDSGQTWNSTDTSQSF